MANISDVIEAFILDNMGEDNEIDISRNELASFFSCAPSQINYVLQTRFTLDRGFIKESRRGGGGYIRISKVSFDNDESVASAVLSSIGEEITENRASQIIERLFDAEIISLKERGIIEAMLSKNENMNLHNQINYYKSIEASLNNSMAMVRNTGEQIKNNALKEREVIINDAKGIASRILNDALIKAERVNMETDKLKRDVSIYKNKVRSLIECQLEIIDDIEKVDI